MGLVNLSFVDEISQPFVGKISQLLIGTCKAHLVERGVGRVEEDCVEAHNQSVHLQEPPPPERPTPTWDQRRNVGGK